MSKIIVADDEKLIRELVCDFLKKDGHNPLTAENGAQAVELMQKNADTALIIMDIMMPGMDGWEATSEIRRFSSVPIMLLTARSQDFDQIMGFESGADDYVTKPFSPVVLMKRVEAVLRRASNNNNAEKNIYWGLNVDEDAHEVRIDGKLVTLTLKEFNILLKLISSVGRVYSREQLLDDVWGFDYDGDIRTVDSHVARLRTKLGAWGNIHLKTVYGVGYKIEEKSDE